MPETRFIQEQLPNGLTVVIDVMPHVQSVACGFLARTGSRDDDPETAGVSHFLEHMMFKGTDIRSWEEINIAFDAMGAQYNAYTSKDRTFYYGWVRTEDFERQLELLAEMMRPALPPDEFDMEKNVILEEIAMSNDDLASNAYDCLYEHLCPGNALAWPILGYDRTIRAMTREQMQAYLARRYAPNNLVLVVAGNVEPERVMAAARRCCGTWEPAPDLGRPRETPDLRTGRAARHNGRFKQQAVVLAFPSVPADHPLEETAEATAAVLGGTNSRFYWNIIQKGLSPRAGAFRDDYADFSILGVFGLCEPESCERLVEAMRAEVESLVTGGAEPREINRVKNLRRTSLASESEAPFYRLGQLVDDVDYRGRPRSVEDRLAAVDAVSAETIRDYLAAFPMTGEGMLVSVGPRPWPA